MRVTAYDTDGKVHSTPITVKETRTHAKTAARVALMSHCQPTAKETRTHAKTAARVALMSHCQPDNNPLTPLPELRGTSTCPGDNSQLKVSMWLHVLLGLTVNAPSSIVTYAFFSIQTTPL